MLVAGPSWTCLHRVFGGGRRTSAWKISIVADHEDRWKGLCLEVFVVFFDIQQHKHIHSDVSRICMYTVFFTLIQWYNDNHDTVKMVSLKRDVWHWGWGFLMLNVRRVYMWCLLCPAVGVNHKLCTVYLYLGVILYGYFWVLLCWITRIIYLNPTQNRIGTSTNLFLLYCTGGTTSHWVHAKAPERIPYPLVNSLTWLEKNHHITCIDDVFFVSLLGSFVTIFHPINGEIFAPTGRRCSGATLQRQGASAFGFFFSLLKVKVCLPGLNPKRKCWGDGWPFFPKLGGYLATLQHGGGNRHTKFLETKKVNKNSKIFFLNSTWN